MTWQEELRRLDAELARGGISHDQHRKLRDELLAAVSGGGNASPVAAPLARSENAAGKDGWQSTNPGYGAAPEPPPAPEPEPAPAPAPEVVAEARRQTASALLTTSRTTTAPSPADQRPTDSMPYPRAIVPSVRPTMPTRGGVQPVPPDLTPEETTARLRLDLGQPPERPTGSRPTWLFLALGVLLVLVMIIGGAWWLGQDGDSPAGDQAAPPPPASTEPASLEDRLPKLPGNPNPANSTMSVDRGVELRLYTAEDAAKMKNAGATEVIYRSSSDETQASNGYTVLVVRTPSPEHAALLAQGMRKSLADIGFAGRPSGNDPDDTTLTGSNPDGRLSVTWYASGDAAVGVGVSQSLADDPGELRQRLEFTLASIGTALPRR